MAKVKSFKISQIKAEADSDKFKKFKKFSMKKFIENSVDTNNVNSKITEKSNTAS